MLKQFFTKENELKFIKHNKDISLSQATAGSAGYDVQASLDKSVVIYPNEIKMIPLGFRVHIENPTMAAILLPRSGLGKVGIVLANTVGLIDSDYQGEVMCALKNTSNQEFVVTPLMRIAQMIFIPVISPEVEIVESFEATTERGNGGFGSTGVANSLPL